MSNIYADKIIELIRKNRISTTEVADCLNKSGVLKDAHAVNRGHFAVGKVRWVYGYNESNWSIHEQVRDVSEGEIVLIENINCGERASIGALVAKYVLLYCQAGAIISNGYLRDGNDLIKENYPVWCKGFTPVGCFNTKQEILDKKLIEQKKELYMGAIAVCDDTGVVIIPKENHNQEFVEKLIQIEQQEDIWFDCLDRLKWDTYEIVCLKRYKNN